MHLISTLSSWAEHTIEQSVGESIPKFYKWKFWTNNNDALKMSPSSTTKMLNKEEEQSRKILYILHQENV